jgi:uncharacterized protein (UPF0332 family)
LNYSDELLLHAIALTEGINQRLRDVSARRAVSAAYYALFHQLNGDAVSVLAPHVPLKTNHRIQRWFDHSEMKRICSRFIPNKLDHPLLELIGDSASPDLQFVARSFIQLQDVRHKADYDLGFALSDKEVWQFIEQAYEAKKAWARLKNSAEANIFILSLLLWKNWEKDR